MEPPYVDAIDWSTWHVFWVDERVVPKDHDDSNYKLAFDGFLSKVYSKNIVIPLCYFLSEIIVCSGLFVTKLIC